MALGFESDERRYDIAARMLTLLGIRQVFLLTNNPGKVSGLADTGIEIMGRIPLIAPVNHENRRYLDAKARRAGHLLDDLRDCAKHVPGA
jgi:GTP cyclohydrolase II